MTAAPWEGLGAEIALSPKDPELGEWGLRKINQITIFVLTSC